MRIMDFFYQTFGFWNFSEISRNLVFFHAIQLCLDSLTKTSHRFFFWLRLYCKRVGIFYSAGKFLIIPRIVLV